MSNADIVGQRGRGGRGGGGHGGGGHGGGHGGHGHGGHGGFSRVFVSPGFRFSPYGFGYPYGNLYGYGYGYGGYPSFAYGGYPYAGYPAAYPQFALAGYPQLQWGALSQPAQTAYNAWQQAVQNNDPRAPEYQAVFERLAGIR